MTEPRSARPSSQERLKAERLRAIKGSLNALGKRGLRDVFTAGEVLEEAAALLEGVFSAWVRSECGIEPRTALGYRKTFRSLGDRKDWLVERKVSPSVAVAIGSASPEGRERALAALASGRSLTVAEAQTIVREARSPKKAESSSREALRRAMRELSASFLEEVDSIVTIAAGVDPNDEAGLADLASRSVAIAPLASVLLAHTTLDPRSNPNPLILAVTDLATATGTAAVQAAAHRLVRAAAGTANDSVAVNLPTTDAAPSPMTQPPTMRSLNSVFRHGLSAIEICAGGGGQAAGLAKAGFRHLALVERDPSACATLRAAFGPEHVVETDLKGYEPASIVPVDLLAGGVPCQPYSQSGERKGAGDERDLFPEALRLVERLRPRAIMLENVMGIFGPENDMHRFRILSRLRRLGYVAEWGSVDATHFGVPQRRLRAVLVAFKDPRAMSRFSWPEPAFGYGQAPATAISSLMGHFTARGWQPDEDFVAAMDRTAPTVTGGSDRKQGIDFGKRKSALVWGRMGFVQTRIGDAPPSVDHTGPVEATNAALATLQAFPFDWPFRGSKKSVFRQVANAFPTPVAMHLGCAIASALTGRRFDAVDQHVFEAMRWNHVKRSPSTEHALQSKTAAA